MTKMNYIWTETVKVRLELKLANKTGWVFALYAYQYLVFFSSLVDIQRWLITHYCWSGTAEQRSAGVSGNLWRAFLKASVDCLALAEAERAFQSVTVLGPWEK